MGKKSLHQVEDIFQGYGRARMGTRASVLAAELDLTPHDWAWLKERVLLPADVRAELDAHFNESEQESDLVKQGGGAAVPEHDVRVNGPNGSNFRVTC